MRNRGYLYRTLLSIMPVVFLAACSNGNPISNVVNKEEQLKGNIEIWCSPDMKDNITYSAGLFSEKNPQLSIRVTAKSTDEVENDLKVENSAGQDYPDIIEDATSKVSYFQKEYPDLLLDVGNEIKKLGDKLLPWKLQEVSIDKNSYAFPWNVDPEVILYNKVLADKYNINPQDIKTWDDFIKFGDKLNARDPEGVKLIELKENSSGDLYKSMMRELRSGLYTNDGSITIPRDETLRALTKIKELYDKGLVYELKDEEDPLAVLKNGTALCMIADGGSIKKINDNQELQSTKWQVERFPAFESGGKNAVCGEGNALMVVKKSQQNDAVLKFIRFMLTDNESTLFFLKNSGMITSVPDLYSLPLFNDKNDNYDEKMVWRFIAEESREESLITYGYAYNSISKSLIQLEQDVIKGKDIDKAIKSKEEELNKP
ncbi:MAG: ABC transporter substrate-binding protein [Bacillota bacterium]|nr:ABC transporter substrate-binding protein [Bacillota bacterium]